MRIEFGLARLSDHILDIFARGLGGKGLEVAPGFSMPWLQRRPPFAFGHCLTRRSRKISRVPKTLRIAAKAWLWRADGPALGILGAFIRAGLRFAGAKRSCARSLGTLMKLPLSS